MNLKTTINVARKGPLAILLSASFINACSGGASEPETDGVVHQAIVPQNCTASALCGNAAVVACDRQDGQFEQFELYNKAVIGSPPLDQGSPDAGDFRVTLHDPGEPAGVTTVTYDVCWEGLDCTTATVTLDPTPCPTPANCVVTAASCDSNMVRCDKQPGEAFYLYRIDPPELPHADCHQSGTDDLGTFMYDRDTTSLIGLSTATYKVCAAHWSLTPMGCQTEAPPSGLRCTDPFTVQLDSNCGSGGGGGGSGGGKPCVAGQLDP